MNVFNLIWDTVVVHPMVNALALFYDILGNNIGLAIIVVTLIFQVLLLPLTLRQLRQQQKLQAIQPQIAALRKKYNTGRPEDKRKMSSETFRLYKQAGISPIGCLGPLILQLPIWIGFYRAILLFVPLTPEGIVELSGALYGWNPAGNDVPFNPIFLGVNMASAVSEATLALALGLSALVGITFFLRQKISTPINVDPTQNSTQRIMLIFLPVIMAFFTWQFPAGLAFYILFSTIIGTVLHWLLSGRPPLWGPNGTLLRTGARGPATAAAAQAEAPDGASEGNESERKEGDYETYVGVHRKNSRRGNRGGSKRAGGKSRRH